MSAATTAPATPISPVNDCEPYSIINWQAVDIRASTRNVIFFAVKSKRIVIGKTTAT